MIYENLRHDLAVGTIRMHCRIRDASVVNFRYLFDFLDVFDTVGRRSSSSAVETRDLFFCRNENISANRKCFVPEFVNKMCFPTYLIFHRIDSKYTTSSRLL